MWSLLKKLMTLVAQYGVAFEDLIGILGLLMDLKRPPSISDEEGFRDWLCGVLHTFIEIADMTPTTIDDTSLRMFDRAIEDDSVWPLIYKLMGLVFIRDSNMRKFAAGSYDTVIPGTMSEMAIARDIVSAGTPPSSTEEELFNQEVTGDIDPGTIVTIATAIYELGQYLGGGPLTSAEIDAEDTPPVPDFKKPESIKMNPTPDEELPEPNPPVGDTEPKKKKRARKVKDS